MNKVKKGDKVVFTLYDFHYEGEGTVVKVEDDYCEIRVISSQIIKVPMDSILEIL